MNISNLLLTDKDGKKVKLYVLANKLQINEMKLLKIFDGEEGYSLRKAVWLSTLCSLIGYNFPPETFMSLKEIEVLNKYLKTWGIQTKKYNPLVG